MSSAGLMEERGSTLVAVLIFTAALLFLSGALLCLSLNEQKIAAYQEQEVYMYYLTEAGVEAGIAALNADYSFQGPLCGALGQGSYRVEIGTLPYNRRLVTSTGHLHQKSFNLSVVAGPNPLYEQALMVSDHLKIENVDIYGNLHVNKDLQIKGSNRVVGTDSSEGVFSYSGDPPWFLTPYGDILIGDKLYTSSAQFDGRTMKVAPIPLPSLDFEALAGEIQCSLEPPPSTITLAVAPACYPEHNRILVNGNLLIAPGEGQEFNFDGLLVVRGNLEIHPRRGAIVNINGMLLAEGDAIVKGEINQVSPDNSVILAACGDVFIRDIEAPLVFGGNLLIFSRGEVNIGPSKLDRFDLRGVIIAKKLFLEKCSLYYVPEMLTAFKDLFPGCRVVIREWIKP
ncbi:MAG TPA: hypothetical protein GX693_01120 [Firmicutes bacterium]|nr:hypothetical protein [Bacillota bacterium]